LEEDTDILGDYRVFKSIVRESFGKRRKTMRNSLKSFFERSNIKFESIDFDFSRRPENLSVHEFILLANNVSSFMSKEIRNQI